MGESKGGFAGRGEDEKRSFKTFVEFQGDTIDSFDIKRVEKRQQVSKESVDGVQAALLIRFNSPPYEKIYLFSSAIDRDRELNRLKAKMMTTGAIVFI